mmetsp:Transcript_5820/g.10478  ORF Transcript_5820/g.10478 Transcript_5820/m.10478 type:complete len:308 (+) Transcript_5820:2074-2997(+)
MQLRHHHVKPVNVPRQLKRLQQSPHAAPRAWVRVATQQQNGCNVHIALSLHRFLLSYDLAGLRQVTVGDGQFTLFIRNLGLRAGICRCLPCLHTHYSRANGTAQDAEEHKHSEDTQDPRPPRSEAGRCLDELHLERRRWGLHAVFESLSGPEVQFLQTVATEQEGRVFAAGEPSQGLLLQLCPLLEIGQVFGSIIVESVCNAINAHMRCIVRKAATKVDIGEPRENRLEHFQVEHVPADRCLAIKATQLAILIPDILSCIWRCQESPGRFIQNNRHHWFVHFKCSGDFHYTVVAAEERLVDKGEHLR